MHAKADNAVKALMSLHLTSINSVVRSCTVNSAKNDIKSYMAYINCTV